MPSASKKHHTKTPRLSPKLIVTLLLLIAAALSGLAYLHVRSTDNQPVLLTVQKKVTNTYSNLSVDTSAWPAQMGSGVSIQAPGYSFQISSQSLPTTYFTMKENVSSVSANSKTANSPHDISSIIDGTITHAGYVAYIDSQDTTTYINKNNDKCLSIFAQNQDVLTLTCYDSQDISAAAAKLQPFVAAYSKANLSTGSTSTFYGPVTIKDQAKSGVITSSYSAGYNIAEAVIQNGTNKQLALFYTKDGGSWQYITQAGDEYGFKCGAYTANPDVRKAMYNQICLSSQGQIRLDTTNRALQ